jgi:hypothetical protein
MISHESKLKYAIQGLVVVVVALGASVFLLAQKESHLDSTNKALTDSQSMEMDMSSMGSMQQMAGMTAQTYNVLAGQPIPTVSFTITPSTVDGYNIHITTTNFTFTPEKIDKAAAPNEGHVHLYVDGALIVVLSPWYHLNKLPPGDHEIRVVLANNDHSLYAVNGQDIQQIQTLKVQ